MAVHVLEVKGSVDIMQQEEVTHTALIVSRAHFCLDSPSPRLYSL